MTDENCIPVKVALQLMDTSSLGLAYKYSSFKHTHQELQNALQSIVNGSTLLQWSRDVQQDPNRMSRSSPRVQ